MVSGKVYICGAGPGDPGLMTVRALELLKACGVILYDRLVSKEIVSQIPSDTIKVYVGRAVGDPTTHQEDTNRKMVEYARKGLDVLRLKGGDPFIFGRGAEEAEYLVENGIAFEIVPGISSAIGSPAYAGIPLTHRSYASSVSIVTGHEEEGKKDSAPSVNWPALASATDTIVVLMGIGQLEQITRDLISSGRKPSTPVAIVENGTTPAQRTITGTLEDISQVAARSKVRPPAVIVIGDVVSVRSRIGWFKEKVDSG